MDTTEEKETKDVEQVKPEPKAEKVTATKQKDPKRVNLGKRLAAHNKKIKEQNVKLRETVNEMKVSDAPTESENTNYAWYALAAVIGLGSIYIFKMVAGKNTSNFNDKPVEKYKPQVVETNYVELTNMED